VTQLPTTLANVDALIASRTPESVNLDYKASPAIDGRNRHEIAKDASAFANSDGGMIIYGVTEDHHEPAGVDGGVDHGKYSREWLEQTIQSNVSPRIADLRIAQISVSDTHSLYAVGIGKTLRGPHQERGSHRFYKRYNFQSVPMEAYEIDDVRARANVAPRLLVVDIEIRQGIMVYLVVENAGTLPARDVSFSFNPNPKWTNAQVPHLLAQGTTLFPPGRRLLFFIDSYLDIISEKAEQQVAFTVTVRYRHSGTDAPLEEDFFFDLRDYLNSAIIDSEAVEGAKKIGEQLKSLDSRLDKIAGSMATLTALADPTGLALSVRTLRNLQNLKSDTGPIEKLDPAVLSMQGLMEVLDITFERALPLYHFFRGRQASARLEELEGMTSELLAKVKDRLRYAGDPREP